MNDPRTIIYNIPCPICQKNPIKKQMWGQTGCGELQLLITCSDDKNCSLWFPMSEEQFNRYNYSDCIYDYFEVHERKWVR